MNIQLATQQYDDWLRSICTVHELHIDEKHVARNIDTRHGKSHPHRLDRMAFDAQRLSYLAISS